MQVDANIELDDVPLSDRPVLTNTVFFLLQLPFIMPQVTCLAQGGYFMNVFEPSTLGGMVLQDTIVFSFNMIPTHQVSVLYVARVRHFFSIRHNKTHFPCALVSWYSTIGTTPCADAGMWKVKPDFDNTGHLAMSIIHLDSMVRSAHLMGIAGTTRIPHHLTLDRSLDAFQAFYVNKYIDHHAHEYAF